MVDYLSDLFKRHSETENYILKGISLLSAAKDFLSIHQSMRILGMDENQAGGLSYVLFELWKLIPKSNNNPNKIQVLHESLGEYIKKEQPEYFNEANHLLIDYCRQWQLLPADEQKYALQFYSYHLDESKEKEHVNEFFNLILDPRKVFISKQLEVFQNFKLAKKIIQRGIEKACSFRNQNVIQETSLTLLYILDKESRKKFKYIKKNFYERDLSSLLNELNPDYLNKNSIVNSYFHHVWVIINLIYEENDENFENQGFLVEIIKALIENVLTKINNLPNSVKQTIPKSLLFFISKRLDQIGYEHNPLKKYIGKNSQRQSSCISSNLSLSICSKIDILYNLKHIKNDNRLIFKRIENELFDELNRSENSSITNEVASDYFPVIFRLLLKKGEFLRCFHLTNECHSVFKRIEYLSEIIHQLELNVDYYSQEELIENCINLIKENVDELISNNKSNQYSRKNKATLLKTLLYVGRYQILEPFLNWIQDGTDLKSHVKLISQELLSDLDEEIKKYLMSYVNNLISSYNHEIDGEEFPQEYAKTSIFFANNQFEEAFEHIKKLDLIERTGLLVKAYSKGTESNKSTIERLFRKFLKDADTKTNIKILKIILKERLSDRLILEIVNYFIDNQFDVDFQDNVNLEFFKYYLHLGLYRRADEFAKKISKIKIQSKVLDQYFGIGQLNKGKLYLNFILERNNSIWTERDQSNILAHTCINFIKNNYLKKAKKVSKSITDRWAKERILVFAIKWVLEEDRMDLFKKVWKYFGSENCSGTCQSEIDDLLCKKSLDFSRKGRESDALLLLKKIINDAFIKNIIFSIVKFKVNKKQYDDAFLFVKEYAKRYWFNNYLYLSIARGYVQNNEIDVGLTKFQLIELPKHITKRIVKIFCEGIIKNDNAWDRKKMLFSLISSMDENVDDFYTFLFFYYNTDRAWDTDDLTLVLNELINNGKIRKARIFHDVVLKRKSGLKSELYQFETYCLKECKNLDEQVSRKIFGDTRAFEVQLNSSTPSSKFSGVYKCFFQYCKNNAQKERLVEILLIRIKRTLSVREIEDGASQFFELIYDFGTEKQIYKFISIYNTRVSEKFSKEHFYIYLVFQNLKNSAYNKAKAIYVEHVKGKVNEELLKGSLNEFVCSIESLDGFRVFRYFLHELINEGCGVDEKKAIIPHILKLEGIQWEDFLMLLADLSLNQSDRFSAFIDHANKSSKEFTEYFVKDCIDMIENYPDFQHYLYLKELINIVYTIIQNENRIKDNEYYTRLPFFEDFEKAIYIALFDEQNGFRENIETLKFVVQDRVENWNDNFLSYYRHHEHSLEQSEFNLVLIDKDPASQKLRPNSLLRQGLCKKLKIDKDGDLSTNYLDLLPYMIDFSCLPLAKDSNYDFWRREYITLLLCCTREYVDFFPYVAGLLTEELLMEGVRPQALFYHRFDWTIDVNWLIGYFNEEVEGF